MKKNKGEKKIKRAVARLSSIEKQNIADLIQLGVDSRKSLERFQLAVSLMIAFVFSGNQKISKRQMISDDCI